MTTNLFRAAVVVAALVGYAADAAAYRLIGAVEAGGTVCAGTLLECGDDDTFARWWNYPVPFWVNEDADADAAEADITQADIVAASQAAYQSWEDVPFSLISFVYQGETPNRLAGLDGKNVTLWYDAALDAGACAGALGVAGGTLAITILTEVEQSGEIIDADVIMDSVDPWEIDLDCFEFDMPSVLTHEYGHTIGVHHTELNTGVSATQPTMFAFVFCDAGIASGRSLEADDEAAAQCLYPELPTVILVDQTGSMCAGDRMPDTQDAANAFIDTYASNVLAVSAFAEGSTGECGGCAVRPGYELLQDWTDDVAALHAAVDGTSACGFTPLWESVCCAITKSEESEPSNLLVFTDTGENSSDGTCGCTTFADVLATANAAGDVSVYVLDMTNYFGLAPTAPPGESSDLPAPGPRDQSTDLATLCAETNGLYVRVDTPSMLLQGRRAIERHMAQNGKLRQRPPTCQPNGIAIDDIQRYTGACSMASPYYNTTVQIQGVVTASRNTWDATTQYVEDCSGGIQVSGTVGPIGQIGDLVTVIGRVGDVFGELRVEQVAQYMIQGHPGEPQTPIVDPSVGQLCESIGSLMSVRGYVEAPVSNFRFTLVSDLGANAPQKLTVFLDPDTGIDPAQFRAGDRYVIRGLLSHRLGQNELKPRKSFDIQLIASTDVTPSAASSVGGLIGLSPNPARGSALVSYALAHEGNVRLEVFDAQGRLVRTLVEAAQAPSRHDVFWDGRNSRGLSVPSGLYFVRLTGPDGQRDARTLAIMR